MYREMLWLSRHMSGDTAFRTNAAREIRSQFRQNMHINDEERVLVLMERARGKLGYMRMQTPQYLLRRFDVDDEKHHQQQQQRFVVEEGRVTESDGGLGRGRAISNWREGNVDPDSLAKHEQLWRRMRFQEGPLKDYQSSLPWLRGPQSSSSS